MKSIFYFLAAFLFSIFACHTPEPELKHLIELEKKSGLTIHIPEVDTSLFETFLYKDKDTSLLMKKYFIVFLKTGPDRTQSEAEAAEIQQQHLAHLEKMAREKKICIVGPSGGKGDIRGFAVYSVPSAADALRLASDDPAVKSGRLVVEVHPWWAGVGSAMF